MLVGMVRTGRRIVALGVVLFIGSAALVGALRAGSTGAVVPPWAVVVRDVSVGLGALAVVAGSRRLDRRPAPTLVGPRHS